jgi:hypothetical protein
LDQQRSSGDQPDTWQKQQAGSHTSSQSVQPFIVRDEDSVLASDQAQLQLPPEAAQQSASSDAALAAEQLHLSAAEQQQTFTSALDLQQRFPAAVKSQISSNIEQQQTSSSTPLETSTNAHEEHIFPTAEEQQPLTISGEWQTFPAAATEQQQEQSSTSSSAMAEETPSVAEQLAFSGGPEEEHPFPTTEEQQQLVASEDLLAEAFPTAITEQQQGGGVGAGHEQLSSAFGEEQQPLSLAESEQPASTNAGEEQQASLLAESEQQTTSFSNAGQEQQLSFSGEAEQEQPMATEEQQPAFTEEQQQSSAALAEEEQTFPSAANEEQTFPSGEQQQQQWETSTAEEEQIFPTEEQQQQQQQQLPATSTAEGQQLSSATEQQQQEEQHQEETTAAPTSQQQQEAATSASGPALSLAGKSCLLIAQRPSPLIYETASSLLRQGAQVTLAMRHPQDSQLLAKSIIKALPEHAGSLLHAQTPLNFGSQASIRGFAAALNASPASLDLLLLHGAEGVGGKRRWYTAEGISGAAQVSSSVLFWLTSGWHVICFFC